MARRRPQRCEVTRKAKFASEMLATNEMRKAIQRRHIPNAKIMNVYLCSGCGAWHMGHDKKLAEAA